MKKQLPSAIADRSRMKTEYPVPCRAGERIRRTLLPLLSAAFLCAFLLCFSVSADEAAEEPADLYEALITSVPVVVAGGPDTAVGTLPVTNPNTYSVGWDLNADGVADIVQSYAYGDLPIAPQNGQRADTAQYRYTFTGWAPEILPVSGPIVYTAQFEQVPQTYLIRCDTDGDGVIDHSESVPYGTIPALFAAVRSTTAGYTFEFIGWSSEPVSVREDTVYVAQYRCTPLNDKSREEYDVSLTVMNTTGEDQWLIVRLLDGNVCVGAIPLDLPNGFNESVSFTGLRKNCYSLQICSALDEDLYFHTQTLHLTENSTALSMLLSGKGTAARVLVDPTSDVVSLGLPRSLLRNEEGDRSFTLEASVVKFSSEEVPYRETLELLAGDKLIGMYLQLLLQRQSGEESQVTAWVSEPMTLALRLPEALRAVIDGEDLSRMSFCRVWDGRSDIILNVPNVYGEFFEYSADDGLLLLHVRGSGYYALSYERARPAPSLWWLMMLCDLFMLVLIWIERRRHFMEYYLKIVFALFVTSIVVLVLAIRSSTAAIVFASIGWFIIVWLLIGKSPDQVAGKAAGRVNEGLFDAFSSNGGGTATWQTWGQGNNVDPLNAPDAKDENRDRDDKK